MAGSRATKEGGQSPPLQQWREGWENHPHVNGKMHPLSRFLPYRKFPWSAIMATDKDGRIVIRPYNLPSFPLGQALTNTIREAAGKVCPLYRSKCTRDTASQTTLLELGLEKPAPPD